MVFVFESGVGESIWEELQGPQVGTHLGVPRVAPLVSVRCCVLCPLGKAKAGAAAAGAELGWRGRSCPLPGAQQQGRSQAPPPPRGWPTSGSFPLAQFSWVFGLKAPGPFPPGAWGLGPAGAHSWAGDWEPGNLLSVSLPAVCAVCLLTWKQRKQYPMPFVVTHLLLNRYKLSVLETLAAPSPH